MDPIFASGAPMQSTDPIPGNPWPHDMVIRVDDSPHPLIELLWIREAHGLEPTGEDLPPRLLDDPDAEDVRTGRAGVDADVRSSWEQAWPRVWADALSHAGKDIDHAELFEQLRETADGSTER